MNALLVLLGLALLFYFMHRMHGQVGGCYDRHEHARGGNRTGEPEDLVDSRAPVRSKTPGPSFATILLVTLILLLPVMLLHAITPTGSPFHTVLFWAALFLPFLVIPLLRGARRLPSREEVLALFFLIMAPVPHRFMTALGILCPYL